MVLQGSYSCFLWGSEMDKAHLSSLALLRAKSFKFNRKNYKFYICSKGKLPSSPQSNTSFG